MVMSTEISECWPLYVEAGDGSLFLTVRPFGGRFHPISKYWHGIKALAASFAASALA
jgi:hypothetical protein